MRRRNRPAMPCRRIRRAHPLAVHDQAGVAQRLEHARHPVVAVGARRRGRASTPPARPRRADARSARPLLVRTSRSSRRWTRRPLRTLRSPGTRPPSGHRRTRSGSRCRRLLDPEGQRSFEQISFHPQLRILGPQLGEVGALIGSISPRASPRSMRSWPTQFPSVPRSRRPQRATSAIERSSSSTIATASRRNSGGYFEGRPTLDSSCWTWTSSYTRCPSNGGMLNCRSRVFRLGVRLPLRDRSSRGEDPPLS